MKVVLLSVIMVITVVHVSPMCTRVSNPNSTKQTRRYIPIKEEKYTTRLNTDDHFSERERKSKQARKLPNWKTHENAQERKKFTNIRGDPNCKMKGNHNNKISTRRDPNYGVRGNFEFPGKSETGRDYSSRRGVLSFRSPKQLQEYLFSEAGNAKHILRGVPSLYGSGNNFGRDEFFPRNLNYVDDYGGRDTTGRSKGTYSNVSNVEPDWTRDIPKYGKTNADFVPTERYRDWKNRVHGSTDNDWYSARRNKMFDLRNSYENGRSDIRLDERNRDDYYFPPDNFGDRNFPLRDKNPYYNPLDIPYLYPPPWYGARTPFFIPRIKLAIPYDRKLYETPSYLDEHPKKTKEKKEDVPVGNDLAKLKQMVDELDAMSEDIKEMSVTATKTEGDRREKDRNDTVADVKDKIDKIIIPILNKISKDLNGTTYQAVAAPPVKKVESVESDMKKEKDKEKERDKDKEKEKDKEREKDREREKDKERDKDKEKDKEKDIDTKKDYPCKIDGIWTGTSEALQLNISTLPNMTVKVSIMSENSKKGNDINKDWTINGLTLASFGGPFMFAAVYPEKKKLANFIGQCRTCREEDIIFGLWTFSTAGRDCAEMFTTVETKIDVFRREKTQQTKTEKSPKALTES